MNINRAKQCTQLVCIKAQPREKSHPRVGRTHGLLNLAGWQKLLPNSICLSSPLSILPAIGREKSNHFRRFSEPVCEFRRPNANRSRLRLSASLLQSSCPAKSSFPSSAIVLFPSHFFFSLARCSKGTLFLPLERTSAGHVSNRLPR